MPRKALIPSLSPVAPLLALAFAVSLSGCLAVPTPYAPDADLDDSGEIPDVRKVVGDSKSKRPLRLGNSTRADVEQFLGEPAAMSADGSVYVYAQQMFSGSGVVLPPLYPASGLLRQRTYFLRLTFDAQEILRSSRVERGESSDAGMGYMLNEPDRVPTRLLAP